MEWIFDNVGMILLRAVEVIFCIGILIIIFRIEDFTKLILKAISLIIQQVCSFAMEALFLVFKIINAVEVYFVLLIDVLTGKVSSNGKIASLAIGLLSIVSFYTTYNGMQYFVEEDFLRTLLTVGIQAILLSTSLRIGNNLIKDDIENSEQFTHGKTILILGISWVVMCVMAYVLGIAGLKFFIKKTIYHVIYLVVIILTMSIIFLLIKEIIRTQSKVKHISIFLFIIYFCVLSVSSFFSYNSFVEVMYQDNLYDQDMFHRYKMEIVEVLEKANKKIDENYYEKVGEELYAEMAQIIDGLNKVELQQLYEMAGLEMVSEDEIEMFQESVRIDEELSNLKQQKEEKEKEHQEREETITANSGGIGYNTRTLLEELAEEYKPQIAQLEEKINNKELERKNYENINKESMDRYFRINDELEEIKDGKYKDAYDKVRYLIKKDALTEAEERELLNAADMIEEGRVKYLENKFRVQNNLIDMVKVYRSYIDFQSNYNLSISNILSINGRNTEMSEARICIQGNAYTILSYIPDTTYVFENQQKEEIKTAYHEKNDYYNKIEQNYRNTGADLSTIEKNIRVFVGNKLIGIMCALMALSIDMMILFVGIILPKNTVFWREEMKYSREDMQRILSNLFNRPRRRQE